MSSLVASIESNRDRASTPCLRTKWCSSESRLLIAFILSLKFVSSCRLCQLCLVELLQLNCSRVLLAQKWGARSRLARISSGVKLLGSLSSGLVTSKLVPRNSCKLSNLSTPGTQLANKTACQSPSSLMAAGFSRITAWWLCYMCRIPKRSPIRSSRPLSGPPYISAHL